MLYIVAYRERVFEIVRNSQTQKGSSVNVISRRLARNETERRQRLPNVLIAGFGKCGTRALLSLLAYHPEVVQVGPEPHFFDRDENYRKGLSWYKSLFPPRLPTQIGIEKSPSYFASEAAPKRIRAMNASIRIIGVVCEPVQRVISRFTQTISHRESDVTHDSLDRIVVNQDTGTIKMNATTIQEGLYYKHVQRWLAEFSLDQMFFVDGGQLIVDPVSELNRVEAFLGLPHYFNSSAIVYDKEKGFHCPVVRGDVKCLDESKGRKHPDVDPLLKQKLADFYEPYNNLFMDMVGRRFKWDVWN